MKSHIGFHTLVPLLRRVVQIIHGTNLKGKASDTGRSDHFLGLSSLLSPPLSTLAHRVPPTNPPQLLPIHHPPLSPLNAILP